ncbi:MAG TPA: hypothetical protein VJ872_10225 [Nocardioides sp.]|nr:hypothetical protein [Nocardioides sp.]
MLRLLALLGFACVAVILCSTSAHADSGDASGHDAAPATKPGLVPGLLKTANDVLRPVVTPLTNAVTNPVTSKDDPAGAAASSTSSTLSPVPAMTGTPDHSAPVALPLHDVLTPVVDAATQVVTHTVEDVSATTSSIPALGLATTVLRTVGTATTQVASSVGSLTGHVDTGLVSVVAVASSLVAPLAGGHRQLPVPGSSSSTGTGTAFTPSMVAATSGIVDLGVLGLREPAGHQSSLTGSGPGVLSAPPQTAGALSAVQPVPAVVVAQAPAFGAGGTAVGSVPGAPVGGSSGLHDQTEAPRGFDFRAVMAIGRACVAAVRPLPGTPLVDPGFSPD